MTKLIQDETIPNDVQETGLKLTDFTYIIREVCHEDKAEWIAMAKEYGHYEEGQDEKLAKDFSRVICPYRNNTGRSYLILKDGVIAGFVNLVIHDFIFRRRPVFYLADLFVKEEFRRQGLGRRLLEFVLEYAKKNGSGRVYWITEDDNPARALYNEYAELGFVRYTVDF